MVLEVNPNFSLSAPARLQTVLDAMEQRLEAPPEKRLVYRKEAQRRVQALADKWSTQSWTAMGDSIRPLVEKKSNAELDGEQAMRQALREAELVEAGVATLTPNTLLAYHAGRTTLEAHPLIHAMLGNHGKLMSHSTAKAQGKVGDEHGDYDSAPWLPPQWYARDGGTMPDVMAQNLHDEGLLKDAYVDTLWAALDSALKTQRGINANFAAAKDAVREIEKQAFTQAREEAQTWRDEQDAMQAKDWSAKASLVRDLKTLDVALAALPAEIRGSVGGFVKLAQLGTEKSRLEEIKRAARSRRMG